MWYQVHFLYVPICSTYTHVCGICLILANRFHLCIYFNITERYFCFCRYITPKWFFTLFFLRSWISLTIGLRITPIIEVVGRENRGKIETNILPCEPGLKRLFSCFYFDNPALRVSVGFPVAFTNLHAPAGGSCDDARSRLRRRGRAAFHCGVCQILFIYYLLTFLLNLINQICFLLGKYQNYMFPDYLLSVADIFIFKILVFKSFFFSYNCYKTVLIKKK